MPLELKEPTFDRPFEEIYRELRSRIPLYNPLWTNYNDSDPGITLLQLFGWLTEMTLHRMNDVPRKNYLKFAQLLGLQLSGPRAATVRLAFTPKTTEPPATIAAGSRFGAQAAGKPVVFETTQALDVIAAPLADVVVFGDGGIVAIDRTTTQPYYPLGRNPAIGSALHLGFKPVPGNLTPFPGKMRFLALRPASVTAGEPQRAGEQQRTLIAPVDLVWEYRPRKGQDVWERLNLFNDETAAFTRDGYIDVEGPQQIEAGVDPLLKALIPEPRYWLRVRLDENRYPAGRAPRLEHLLANAVDAVNLQTETEQVLGTSDGRADQRFTFPARPVEPDSLVIESRDATGRATPWTRRDDFYASTKEQFHFVLDGAAGTITFGDGAHGRIPPAGETIVAPRWRHGGGAAGHDVEAGAVKTLISQVAGIEKVTNPRAATGGSDEEDIAAFLKRAPSEVRRAGRAVTEKDFATFATAIDGVQKARALGGRHPDFPGVEVPGAVTVVVVADSEAMPPHPSAELVRSVCQALDGVRLITSEVYVSGPTFIEVRIEARLFAAADAAFDAVAQAARRRVDTFLSPRTRQFGENVSPAALYATLYGEPGSQVRSVEDLLVYVNGLPHATGRPIEVPPDAIVYPGAHVIVVRPDQDLFGS